MFKHEKAAGCVIYHMEQEICFVVAVIWVIGLVLYKWTRKNGTP